MGIRGGRGFVGETLWRPIAKAMALFVGLVSVSAAIGVGGSWTFGIKVLVVVALLLLTLLISVLYVAYLLYKKVDRPLSVRKVSKGTHYYENNVMVLLERSDNVLVGDVLTLFVREGDVETPVCLLSVEMITNLGFPQSVVFFSFTDASVLDYLSDESRLEQLQAKRGVTKEHLNPQAARRS